MKYLSCIFVFSATAALSACGSSSSSSTPGVSPDPESGSLASLLQTGADPTDTVEQWDCDGNDGQDPVSFSQQFFANGEGQIIAFELAVPFTWTVDSGTVFSVTFPADSTGPAESFSVTNVTFSTINTLNDQYDGIDSRNGTALSCARTATSSTPTPTVTAPISTLIVNAQDTSDFQWSCTLANLPGATVSYEFIADGTGRRFGPMFSNEDPAISWFADDANQSINFTFNGSEGSLGAISFQNEDSFTAVDSFEADTLSCSRSDIPNAPTAPPQPELATSCPCSFGDVKQFLDESASQSTTVVSTTIAGGLLLDIDLPGTTFQLSARDLGVRDCSLTFTGTDFIGENNQNVSGYPQVRADTCTAELNEIIDDN